MASDVGDSHVEISIHENDDVDNNNDNVPEHSPNRLISRADVSSRVESVSSYHGETTGSRLRRSSTRSTRQDKSPVEQVLITQDQNEEGEGDREEADEGEAEDQLDVTAGAGQQEVEEAEDKSASEDDGGHDKVDPGFENGYDTDLEEHEEGEFDPSGIKDYIHECNRLGVIPCNFFQRHVHTTHFCMRNHGLGPLGAKAIAKPLEVNTSIEKIDLEGNCIEATGARYLARTIKDNTYITEIVLSENNLSTLGAQSMCEMLMENSTVRIVNLSGNNFCDTDGDFFLKLLENNSTIRQLSLSHNHFGSIAAQSFKDALSINESLRVLDLSWNHFRLRGACLLAEGITENYGLKELYLSMNGFAKEGARAMGNALKLNQCLEKLDLSSNRITAEGALEIGRALASNSDLKYLKIGGNPISHIGALTLLTAINKNENTEMNYLHIEGVVVNDDFEALHTKMNAVRPFTVLHGGVMSKKPNLKAGHTKHKTDQEVADVLMGKLRKYIDDSGFRLVDLFKSFDKDKSWSVDKQEFMIGVQKSGISMTEEEIIFLTDRLDKNGDGEIEYGELVHADNRQRTNNRKKVPTPELEDSEDDVDRMLSALDETTSP